MAEVAKYKSATDLISHLKKVRVATEGCHPGAAVEGATSAVLQCQQLRMSRLEASGSHAACAVRTCTLQHALQEPVATSCLTHPL
jgi:hypothetical protein